MPDSDLFFASVWLDFPIAEAFDYRVLPDQQANLQVGDWVVVPWGRKQQIGVVQGLSVTSAIDPAKIKPLAGRLSDAPSLPPGWFALGTFAAAYYHRRPGEIMLPGIPRSLRAVPGATRLKTTVFERARKRWPKQTDGRAADDVGGAPTDIHPAIDSDDRVSGHALIDAHPLTDAQHLVVSALNAAGAAFGVHLLHGITGSGKTEVYLHWIAQRLARDPGSQILLLVPEIGLTPQLARVVQARLPVPMAILHSGLAEGQRAANWLAVADGRARIVVGTRLAILAPMPGLAGIVVDEEHDPSFKQAEGAHYSARDLAIVAARIANVPIILGSATPALETWHSARTGRFQLHRLLKRASGAPLPEISIETLRESTRASHRDALPPGQIQGLSSASVAAIKDSLERDEQTMVFINRRGYAPVINCRHCGWLSQCEQCAAYRVLHRMSSLQTASSWRLICHHCGIDSVVPRVCPACGDVDLKPVGQGTQRVEEVLAAAFPGARIGRLDRDVARHQGATTRVLESIHDGELDIIVGTQMLTKGHDFKRLNLVIVLDADGGLFAADFRAPERLFATLMQVAGRAGRHISSRLGGHKARVIVQTRFASHPLFAALVAHDYDEFANAQLLQRRDAMLPPFSHQALLKCDGVALETALDFLRAARASLPESAGRVTVYDPVPMPLARLAGRARAQLLIESMDRPALHHCIGGWLPALPVSTPRLRWQLEVDPAEI